MRTFGSLLVLMALLVSCGHPSKEKELMAQVSYAGKVNAPDFPKDLAWLNTDHPVSLRDLRGKVVLLDFWTFCCINCMHVIPDLKRLEAKYPNELAVIGVHSAKFTTEQGTENIRQAILRYGIEHPVINDKDFDVWNSYGANAWPTFMLIDPDGKLVGKHSGEGVYDALDGFIAGMIKEFDAQGKINRTPLHYALEKDKAPESVLAYPGKIAADASGTRLFVTDSNHNRVLIITASDGTVQEVIGSGQEGLADGSFEEARFRKPQGIAVDGNAVYVADTENHAIRKIDLARKTVVTLAGTGGQAREFNVAGRGRSVALNSPWDLLVRDGVLYITMAGSHQIWTLDLASLDAKPYAGTGREDILDGPRNEAALAQPSGISTDGTQLYIADSEVSAVRVITPGASGTVKTIVGKGLFDFGDRDGTGDEVRLQHPIGACFNGGFVYVADTYNNKIKKIDPRTRKSVTVIGTGQAGMADGDALKAQLNEPNGLCFIGNRMYITDTNNHLIRVFDVTSGKVSTLALRGIERMTTVRTHEARAFNGTPVNLAEQQVSSGDGVIDVVVRIPKGYKLNNVAPFYIGYHSENSNVVRLIPKVSEQNIPSPAFPISIPATFGVGRTAVEIDLVVYYCEEEKESLCLIKQLKVNVPVEVLRDQGAKSVNVEVAVGEGK